MKQPKPIMRQMVAAVLLGQLNIDQTAEQYKVNRMTALRWIRKIEEEANSGHPFRKYLNLFNDLVVKRPNQLWPDRRCGICYNLLVYSVRMSLNLVRDQCLSLRRPGPNESWVIV